uniref:Uncharacterized protein n=1 Tax=Physcomitrium patens TaxID=3218 RepID=A0A2K1K8I7_PHYPA|nr:hypothetical protein PHYPA_011985 [Physcomitrium patens]
MDELTRRIHPHTCAFFGGSLLLFRTLGVSLLIELRPSPSLESDRHLPEQVPVQLWNCRRASRCASARSPIDARVFSTRDRLRPVTEWTVLLV